MSDVFGMNGSLSCGGQKAPVRAEGVSSLIIADTGFTPYTL